MSARKGGLGGGLGSLFGGLSPKEDKTAKGEEEIIVEDVVVDNDSLSEAIEAAEKLEEQGGITPKPVKKASKKPAKVNLKAPKVSKRALDPEELEIDIVDLGEDQSAELVVDEVVAEEVSEDISKKDFPLETDVFEHEDVPERIRAFDQRELVARDTQILEVPIDKVHPNPDQPRKYFSQESIEELSKSIAQKGVLQPLLVEREDDYYIIIAGERRYRASQLAGLSTLPVIIYEFSDAERYEIAIIENVQREDLNPMEEARAYKRLMDKTGMTQNEVAAKIGKSRSAVANALRLNGLPRQAQIALEAGEISSGHGRAILSVHTPEDQRVLFRKIVSQHLTVRDAEREAQVLNGVKPLSFTAAKPQQKITPAMADIQDELMELLGTKVRLKGQESKGSIEISYYSDDDLDRIFKLITKK